MTTETVGLVVLTLNLLSMHSAFTAIKLLLNVACSCRDSLLSTSCLSLAFIPYCNMGVGSLLLQNDIKAPFCSLMIHVIYSVGHFAGRRVHGQNHERRQKEKGPKHGVGWSKRHATRVIQTNHGLTGTIRQSFGQNSTK